jgi:hypothetical protein
MSPETRVGSTSYDRYKDVVERIAVAGARNVFVTNPCTVWSMRYYYQRRFGGTPLESHSQTAAGLPLSTLCWGGHCFSMAEGHTELCSTDPSLFEGEAIGAAYAKDRYDAVVHSTTRLPRSFSGAPVALRSW